MKKALFLLLCLARFAPAQFYNISTIAGVGRTQFAGAGGAATSARLIQPGGVAADSAGNIYISDGYYQQVFQVSPGGAISVYAGNGVPGFSGDGGPAASAQLFNPGDMAVDAGGNLYICDFSNSRVRKVTPGGTISTVYAGARGSAYSVALDAAGDLYMSLVDQHVILMMDPVGAITTIAGNGKPGFSGDNGPAVSAMLSHPLGIKLDNAGNLYVADNYNHRIRKITPQGTITTFAGNGRTAFAGDGGPATSATLFYPTDVATSANGNVYIADATHERIRLVNAAGTITTFAGGGASMQNGPALQALLQVPSALAIDSQGNIVFPLSYLGVVRHVTPQQAIVTVAGAPTTRGAGDGGPAAAAAFLDPHGIASDSAGNLYVADQVDNRIRKISASRIITTIAGTGVFGSSGDGGPAINAQIGNPRALGLDPFGNVYFTTPTGALVRRVTPGGTISRFAGGGGIGFAGDGGPANAAQLSIPLGVVGDAQGNVYISDAGSAHLRRVDSAGIITTLAGTGVEGFSGDNGPAVSAQVYQPRQLVADKQGNLYFADQFNHRVRKIAPGGIITTVAGNGFPGFTGDGGPATAAQVGLPDGVALDAAGNLYITTGSRIRKVDGSTGMISTIAGTGSGGFSGDGGLATLAAMNLPGHLAVDGAGNVYVVDRDNQRLRQLTPLEIVREGVANGATHLAGGVAPGEIVTIFSGPGIALGPAAGAGLQLDASGKVATQIAGIQALFDGIAAPLIYVNGGQVSAIVPYEVAGKATTQLQVIIQGKPTNTVTLPVVDASPGVFAITNSDGTPNTVATAAPPSDVLVIVGTGEGLTNPAVPDGTVNASVFPAPVLPVSVQIAGQEAAIIYAGAAPGYVAGVLQINAQIPAGVSGTVPIVVQIGGAKTPPGLMVSVRAQ